MVELFSDKQSRRFMPKNKFAGVLLRVKNVCINDPSAGSPTETLLRLFLPLNDKVYTASRNTERTSIYHTRTLWFQSTGFTGPFIGRSDGRCVQRAGT